jgi:hypothetical protein
MNRCELIKLICPVGATATAFDTVTRRPNFRMARMREFVHTGKSTTTRTHQSSLIDPV